MLPGLITKLSEYGNEKEKKMIRPQENYIGFVHIENGSTAFLSVGVAFS